MGLFDSEEGKSLLNDYNQDYGTQVDELDPFSGSSSDQIYKPVGYSDEPQWNLDLMPRFEAGIQESFATLWGGLGMASDIVGLDSARDWTMGRSNELFEKAADHDFQTTSFKEIDGIGDLSKFLTEGIIGVAPDIIGTILAGTGLATGISKVAGKGIIKKIVQKGAKKKLKGLVDAGVSKEDAYKTVLKEIGGMAGVGAYTTTTGAGGMYSTDYNMEGDETSPWAALGGGVAQGAITLLNPFSKVLAGIAAKKGAAEIGKMAIGEALEEVSQGGIEKLHQAGIDPNLTVEDIFSDPDTYWQLAEAGVLGAFVGGVFGGVGSKLNSKEEAADLIRMGEERFAPTTPPTTVDTPLEGDAVPNFKEEWAQAEGRLKLTNKALADNTDIQAAMAKGAEGVTTPVAADPTVAQFTKEAEKYKRQKNLVPIQASFTEMTGDGSVKGAIDYLKKAETAQEMDNLVGAYRDSEYKPIDVQRFEAIVDRYRKAKNIEKRTAKDIEIKQDMEAEIKKGAQLEEDVARISEGMTGDPEAILSAKQEIVEGRMKASKQDPTTSIAKPTKTVGYLLEGTPEAAIAHVRSTGNPTKVLTNLREQADAYIESNPHAATLIEDNLKEVQKAVKVSRGIARDVKGTTHAWKPYEVDGTQYGDWLQVKAGDKDYVMFKSPEHGNKFIISETLQDPKQIKGTTTYKTKKEAKLAFEKVLPSKTREKRTTRGMEKPKSQTLTYEVDKNNVPLMKVEGKGISKSSDGKYTITNSKPGTGHGKFYVTKGEESLNNGVPFKSLKDATDFYKKHTDGKVDYAKPIKKAKPKVKKVEEVKTISKEKYLKDKELARKKREEAKKKEVEDAKEYLTKDLTQSIVDNKKDFDQKIKDVKPSDMNVSSTYIDKDKINIHPDISARVAKYIAAYADYLGVDTKGMYVMPVTGKASDIPNTFPTKAIDRWTSKGAKTGGFYSGRHNVLAIRTEGKTDPEIYENVTHELFHKFKFDIFDKMSTQDKQDVDKAYKQWLSEVKGITPKGKQNITDIYKMVAEPVRGEKGIASLTDASYLDKDFVDYLTNFDEFFATQGAKWAIQDKGSRSLASKVFAKVADFFWKVYSIYSKGAQVTVKPVDGFSTFMKKYMRDQAKYKRARLEEIKFDLSELDLPSVELDTKVDAKKQKAKDYAMSPEEATAYFKNEADKPATEKLKDKASQYFEKALGKFDDYTLSINERLRKIHPRLRHFMNKYEAKLNKNNSQDGKNVNPFLQKVSKLDEATQNELNFYLRNMEDKKYLDRAMKMVDDLGLRKEYDKVQDTLGGIYDRAEEVGLNVEKKLTNYFPSSVKDMRGLINYMSNNPEDAGPLTPIINDKNMSEANKADAIQTFMNTGRLPTSMIKTTGSSMKRSIKVVNPKMMKFYHSIEDTLQRHIEENNAKIEGRSLLGVTNAKNLAKVIRSKKSTDAQKQKAREDLMELNSQEGESDEDITTFLKKTGLSLNNDEQKLTLSLIRARLNQRGMTGMMGRVRDMGLITALGSPLNTLTQLGDLPLVIYKMGLKDTAKAMKVVGSKKGEISYDQMNLSNVLQEFQTTGTSKWVDTVLKTTGFSKVDRFFKEVYSQAVLDKTRKMDKDTFIKKHTEEYGEKEAAKIYDKIKAGDVHSDEALTFVFSEISEMQPISLSEMPKGYLEAGNTRILYTLKSYSMKMLATMRREMVDEVSKGNYGKATKNFVRLIPMLVLANASVDELKDLLTGEEEPFSDQVMNNFLKLFLFSKYDMDKVGDKGPSQFLIKMITPPITRPVDNMLKDAVNLFPGNDDPTYAIMQDIPLVGRLAYKRTQEGRTKVKRSEKLSIREDIRDALEGGSSLNSIRKRIAVYNRNLPKGTKRMPYSVISEIRKDIRKKRIDKIRGK